MEPKLGQARKGSGEVTEMEITFHKKKGGEKMPMLDDKALREEGGKTVRENEAALFTIKSFRKSTVLPKKNPPPVLFRNLFLSLGIKRKLFSHGDALSLYEMVSWSSCNRKIEL